MALVVLKAGIKREKGWLYFLDKKGNIARVKMTVGRKRPTSKPQTVLKCALRKENGFLYFIDKDGNVGRAKLKRGGKRKKKK